MTAPTHIAVAIASSIFTAKFFKVDLDPTGFILLIAGSLFPDIDGGGVITRPGTILKRFLNRPLILLFDFFGAVFSEIFRKLTGHRGLFHWLLWPLILIYFSSKTSSLNLFWFGLGYLTHVFIDALTPFGVPLLAPLRLRRFNLMWIRTGSISEFVVFGLSLLYSFIFCWSLLPEGVQTTLSKLYGEL